MEVVHQAVAHSLPLGPQNPNDPFELQVSETVASAD